MKRKLIGIVLLLVMLLSLASCSCSCIKSDDKYDYDLSEYITLANYKDYNVEIELDSIQAAIDSYLMDYSTEYMVTKGDDVIVDIVAYDVVHFTTDAGTVIDQKSKEPIAALKEEGFLIKNVGSGNYAQRVEANLIGSKVGVTTSLKTTLPSNFYVEEYQEKEVFIDIKFVSKECKAGDVVLVNYVGYFLDENGNKIPDTAENAKHEYKSFDEATGAKFYLGSRLAIEGFEESIMGMKINDVRSFKATFPDDYSNEEVKGKEVEFEVKLTKIYVAPIYDDDFVKEKYDYETTEEFETALKENYILTSIYEYLVKNSTVHEYPKAEYQTIAQELETAAQPFLDAYNITLDKYIETYFGMTRDEYIKSNLKSEMIYYSIARNEGIEPTQEEILDEMERLVEYYKNYYMTNEGLDESTAKDQANSFVNALGGEAYATQNVMFELVDKLLKENTKVTYKPTTHTSITITIAEANKPVTE